MVYYLMTLFYACNFQYFFVEMWTLTRILVSHFQQQCLEKFEDTTENSKALNNKS